MGVVRRRGLCRVARSVVAVILIQKSASALLGMSLPYKAAQSCTMWHVLLERCLFPYCEEGGSGYRVNGIIVVAPTGAVVRLWSVWCSWEVVLWAPVACCG
ncbi:unnamed protein product [Ectocarpus sp. 12 AP-2014]